MSTSGSQPSKATDQHQPSALFEERDSSTQTLAKYQTGLYPQIVLFGDSITQQLSLSLGSRLQELYVRRADVVNRGFSGYTSSLALETLPYILPPPPPPPPLPACSRSPPIRLLTLFFGANDAALPGNAQHVPLLTYTSCLRQIIEYPLFRHHGTKVVLITPGPVNEWQLTKPLTRTAANARCYARAARDLARQMHIPCVDLWTAFMKLARSESTSKESDTVLDDDVNNNDPSTAAAMLTDDIKPSVQQLDEDAPTEEIAGSLSTAPNSVLATLLADGLHFSPRGYEVMYEELMAVLRDKVPDCLPEHMPFVFKPWRDVLMVQETPAVAAPAVNASDDSFVVIENDDDDDAKLDRDANERSVDMNGINCEQGQSSG